MMKLFLFLISVLVLLNSNGATSQKQHKEPPKLVRSFTLTPGYMERTFNSNEMMRYGPLSLMQLTSKTFDAVLDATGNNNLLTGLMFILPQCWLSLANNVVYHEFGHARADAAYGTTYTYFASHSAHEDTKTSYAYGLYLQKILNPSFFLEGARTSPSKDAQLIKNVPKKFLDRVVPNASTKHASILTRLETNTPLSQQEQADLATIYHNFSLYMSVGGLNNNSKYAQSISDIIYNRKGHFVYWTDYFVGKTTPFFYWNILGLHGDVGAILSDYKAKNIVLEGSNIANSCLASLFLSSTTWAFVYSAFTELPKGSFLVHAPVWHGWRLPDLNFYLTTQGLSFEVVTGYQFNENWYVGLTAEMVYKGNSAYEFGPSIGYKLNTPSGEFALSAQAIIGNDMEFGGNAGVEWTSSGKDWTVGLKYIYHNALTLVGERNIPFLCSGFMNGGEPSTTNHEANITVSYNY